MNSFSPISNQPISHVNLSLLTKWMVVIDTKTIFIRKKKSNQKSAAILLTSSSAANIYRQSDDKNSFDSILNRCIYRLRLYLHKSGFLCCFFSNSTCQHKDQCALKNICISCDTSITAFKITLDLFDVLTFTWTSDQRITLGEHYNIARRWYPWHI